MSASALPETLKSVTATKIIELKKQRTNFETSKAQIVTACKQQSTILSKSQALLDGYCKLEGVRLQFDSDTESDREHSASTKAPKLRNQQFLLRQAKFDPSFPLEVVENVQQELVKDLELKSVQHEHAQFFSELVTEWISNPDTEIVTTSEQDNGSDMSSSFEDVGRKEMHSQRAEWESLVFARSVVDTNAINAYLEKLFKSSKSANAAYEELKRNTSARCAILRFGGDLFDSDDLKTSIKGLLATDLLSDEKRAILKTFSANKEVLKEVADVLNMRFTSLDTWTWSVVNGAIPLEQRRQLNGKYRVFMDEDVLDALLIHAIGMKWAVFFKKEFTTFFNSFAWQRGARTIPKSDLERREYFLGKEKDSKDWTVQNKRKSNYASDYFMTQLPQSETEGVRAYDDSEDDDKPTTIRKGPLETKHSLLHLVITEMLLTRHLRPDTRHAVIRSDFKWFGPSLPHATIFAVLRFFGMNDFWLKFFKKFLESPLRFSQDGSNGQIQVRKRGVPMSHALSDVFSEVVMFVMDYAVNHATKANMYRLHDDFWFWGSVEVCTKAWHEMKVFASVMGLEFNDEKTGTVVFQPVKSDPSDVESDEENDHYQEGLPTGEIRWGFLRLDATSARFEIDQNMVDEHIQELQLQLSYCRSIFSYIQAYNAYFARFFSNNFGKPSFGFGRAHVDMMIDTFARIQKKMFPQGSVTQYLANIAEERFGVKDIPEGFWYWPIQMGGVELRNPLIPLFAMRESIYMSPERLLEKSLENDEAAYLKAKEKFELSNSGSGLGKYNHELHRKIQASDDDFMSKDEFLKYREERSHNLGSVYAALFAPIAEKGAMKTPEITALLSTMTKDNDESFIRSNFRQMQPYWKWIVTIHGVGIVQKFGSVQMVDPGQVPLGVVSVMKGGKVRWKG